MIPEERDGRVPGRVGPHRESHDDRLLLSNFRRFTLAVTLPWDGSHGITNWGIDGNADYGDCGAAATDHGNMAKAANAALYNTLGEPTFAGTLPTYFAYGIAMGEPGPQPDQGVDNSTWLGFLYKNGIIDGYGEVPMADLAHYAADFNGVLLGVQLSDNAQQQFADGIAWGQPGDVPNPNLGHDVWLIQLHADGSGAVITWGEIHQVTAAFLANFVTDVWAPLDKDDADRVGIVWGTLVAALQDIHGTVTPPPAPAPAPPSPPPAPTPAPPPPKPSPEVLAWWDTFVNWLKSL